MITANPQTWLICAFCNKGIAPWFISRERTWVVLGADRPCHEKCYLERRHEGQEAQEAQGEVQATMELIA